MTARRIATDDKHYMHYQGVPSTEWLILHNLGKQPAIGIEDTAGNGLDTKIVHDSLDQSRAFFKSPTAGKASCN